MAKKKPTQVAAFRCEECHDLCLEDDINDDDALYECSSCGNTFNRESTENNDHRCPECNKFGARQEGRVCPNCSEGVVEPVIAWACPKCGKPNDGESRAADCCKPKKPPEKVVLEEEVEWDGIPESQLVSFEHPVELLQDPSQSLPKHVRHNGWVYSRGSGAHFGASDLFGGGRCMQVMYTVYRTAFVTYRGKSVDLHNSDHPNLTCPREWRGFTLYWRPQGLVLSPAGAVWGERHTVHDDLPDDLVPINAEPGEGSKGQ